MRFTFDEQPDQEPEFEILKPGWYDFKIKAAWDTNQEGQELIASNGVKYYRFKCEELESGVTIPHALFLDEKQSKKVYFFLVATGNEPDGNEIDITPEMFIENEFRGRVEITAQGRNKITRANPKPSEQVQEKEESFVPKEPKNMDPDLDEDVPF